MQIERRPDPNTKMGQVFSKLEQGLVHNEITAELGLSPRDFSVTVANLRREGYIGQLTHVERSLNRVEIWPNIQGYAQMGMFATEIHLALNLRDEWPFEISPIGKALTKARMRGELPPFKEEEKFGPLREAKGSSTHRHERVTSWLYAQSALESNDLLAVPQGRPDWLTLAGFLIGRRRIWLRKTGQLDPRDVGEFDGISFEDNSNLGGCFEVLRSQIPLPKLVENHQIEINLAHASNLSHEIFSLE